MVPLLLRLRNFMCYREDSPVLDLEGIPVACLSGENGHGKTALLEAMTWALWGAARGRKDLDEDLMFVGASDMEVEFDFAAKEQRYRVIRKRSRPTGRRPGQTILDLQIEGLDGFRSISGSTVNETQRAILDIVRMQYDTFVSSAFLLQGHDDLFTAELKPADRKRLLGEVLGLDAYETLARRAREEGQFRKAGAGQRQRDIAEMERALEGQSSEDTERARCEALLAQVTKDLGELQTVLEEAQRHLAEMEAQQVLRVEIEEQRRLAERQRQSAEAEAAARQARLKTYEGVKSRREAIHKGYRQLQAGREREAHLAQALQRYVELQRRQHASEQAIEAARHELEGRRALLAGWIKELQLKADTQPRLSQDLESAKAKLIELDGRAANLRVLREREDALSEDVVRLVATNEGLKKEMEALRERIDLLQEDGAVCPLCQQLLDDEHRQELLTTYQAEGEKARDGYRANEAAAKEQQRQRDKAREERAQLERALVADQEAAQRRLGQLQASLEEAERALQSVVEMQHELAPVLMTLESESYAAEAREILAQVRAEIAEIGYDDEAHRAASQQVTALASFEEEARLLAEAEARWDEEMQAMVQADEAAQRWAAAVEGLEKRLAVIAAALIDLPQLQATVQAAMEQVATLQQQRDRAQVQLGAALQRLDHLAAMARRVGEARVEMKALQEEQSLYEELARAFGPNGVPALLIERAIPNLENNANELLARMTDSRLAIKLMMQRPTQRGGSSETLEIRVSDEHGTRRYETYSGGESFRINFALRVALSKFLAHRAGAPLPTLFIDEGFGSQDIAGREKLVEAIDAIRDDFERILVITHMEDVKDAFPVRIEVTKTEDGATFVVR